MGEEKDTKKARGAWGETSTRFIHSLKDEEVLVTLITGKAIRGVLIGADPYTLVVRQSSGLELLIGKGNVLYLHPMRASANKGGTS